MNKHYNNQCISSRYCEQITIFSRLFERVDYVSSIVRRYLYDDLLPRVGIIIQSYVACACAHSRVIEGWLMLFHFQVSKPERSRVRKVAHLTDLRHRKRLTIFLSLSFFLTRSPLRPLATIKRRRSHPRPPPLLLSPTLSFVTDN